MKRLTAFLILIGFVLSSLDPTGKAYAQAPIQLPTQSSLVSLTSSFQPPILKGVVIDQDNPFSFNFLLDQGEMSLSEVQVEKESKQLIKYFLASLTTPEDDLWVNLSPFEKDRIIPELFGQTEMGRDLLNQDYLLKQLAASLSYPESALGKKFWDEIHKKTYDDFGATEIPVDAFSKVWVVPQKAVVYENGRSAYVQESRLKVMLKGDSSPVSRDPSRVTSHEPRVTNIIEQIILPAIEKEVNEGKYFAKLRQIYNSLILATWYKNKLKNSILNKVYANQNKINGIAIKDKNEKDKIYAQYLEALKKGAYNYIKEEVNPDTHQVMPKKYFSGGFGFKDMSMMMKTQPYPADFATLATPDDLLDLGVNFFPAKAGKDHALMVAEDDENVSPVKVDVGDYSTKVSYSVTFPFFPVEEVYGFIHEGLFYQGEDLQYDANAFFADRLNAIQAFMKATEQSINVNLGEWSYSIHPNSITLDGEPWLKHKSFDEDLRLHLLSLIDTIFSILSRMKDKKSLDVEHAVKTFATPFQNKIITFASDEIIHTMPQAKEKYFINREERQSYTSTNEEATFFEAAGKQTDKHIKIVARLALAMARKKLTNDPLPVTELPSEEELFDYDDILKDNSMTAKQSYPLDTQAGHYLNILQVLQHHDFIEETGFDLTKGAPVFVDYGVGASNGQYLSFMDEVHTANPKAKVVVTEVSSMAAKAYIRSPKLFDAFRVKMASIMQDTDVRTIKDLILVVNQDGEVVQALVEYEDYMSMWRSTFAVKKDLNHHIIQSRRTWEIESKKRSGLLKEMKKFLGKENIEYLIEHGRAPASDKNDMTIEMDPIKTSVEEKGGEFLVSDYALNEISQPNVVIASKVVNFMTDEEKKHFHEAVKKSLRQGGVYVEQFYDEFNSSFEIRFYQKTEEDTLKEVATTSWRTREVNFYGQIGNRKQIKINRRPLIDFFENIKRIAFEKFRDETGFTYDFGRFTFLPDSFMTNDEIKKFVKARIQADLRIDIDKAMLTQKEKDQIDQGLTYEQAKRWRKRKVDDGEDYPHSVKFFAQRETRRNLILATLDTIWGFKPARERGDIKRMKELYTREVINYKRKDRTKYTDNGQFPFFTERGGLHSLMTNAKRDGYFRKSSSPAELIKFAVTELIDITNPDALDPLDVEKKYWTDPENAKYHILLALDTIPGFKEAREDNDIIEMARLYRKHVLYYDPKNKKKYKRSGQLTFFYEVGGLKVLMEEKRDYFPKKGSPESVLNLAIPGLINDRKKGTLKTAEVRKAPLHKRFRERHKKDKSMLAQEEIPGKDWLLEGDSEEAAIREEILNWIARKNEEAGDAIFKGEEALEVARQIVDKLFENKTNDDELFEPDEAHSKGVSSWATEFYPEGGVALAIAALAHDIDRVFDKFRIIPELPKDADQNLFKGKAKLVDHPKKSAQLICAFLKAANVDEKIIQDVYRIIQYHEAGVKGFPGLLEPLAKDDPLYDHIVAVVDGDSMGEFTTTAMLQAFNTKNIKDFLDAISFKLQRMSSDKRRQAAMDYVKDHYDNDDDMVNKRLYAAFKKAQRIARKNLKVQAELEKIKRKFLDPREAPKEIVAQEGEFLPFGRAYEENIKNQERHYLEYFELALNGGPLGRTRRKQAREYFKTFLESLRYEAKALPTSMVEEIVYAAMRHLTQNQKPLDSYKKAAYRMAVNEELPWLIEQFRSEKKNGVKKQGLRAINLALAGNKVKGSDLRKYALSDETKFKSRVRTLREIPRLHANDVDDLLDKLLEKKGQTVLYFLDNVLEDVFELPFIKWLIERGHNVVLVAKKSEAYNDTTIEDARRLFNRKAVKDFLGEEKIRDKIKIISSGSECKGTDWRFASNALIDAWQKADVVILKGEGNRIAGLNAQLTKTAFALTVSKNKTATHDIEVGKGVIEKIDAAVMGDVKQAHDAYIEELKASLRVPIDEDQTFAYQIMYFLHDKIDFDSWYFSPKDIQHVSLGIEHDLKRKFLFLEKGSGATLITLKGNLLFVQLGDEYIYDVEFGILFKVESNVLSMVTNAQVNEEFLEILPQVQAKINSDESVDCKFDLAEQFERIQKALFGKWQWDLEVDSLKESFYSFMESWKKNISPYLRSEQRRVRIEKKPLEIRRYINNSKMAFLLHWTDVRGVIAVHYFNKEGNDQLVFISPRAINLVRYNEDASDLIKQDFESPDKDVIAGIEYEKGMFRFKLIPEAVEFLQTELTDIFQPHESKIKLAAFTSDESIMGKRPVGGVDLTFRDFEMQAQGRGVDVNLPTPLEIDQMQIDGLVPVIFNISPVHDLPMFLGLKEDHSREQLTMSH